MPNLGELIIKRIGAESIAHMRAVNALYAEAFEAPRDYPADQPSDAYLQRRLTNPNVIALAAFTGDRVVGGADGLYFAQIGKGEK